MGSKRDVPAPRLTKGQRTRRRIVAEAAKLFNAQGYAGTAVLDVSQATGLEKGAVYNYFPTKDALALAAFEHNAAIVTSAVRSAVAGAGAPAERLRAVLDPYRDTARRPLVKGGCPLLNTAIEADDGHPVLRERVRKVFAAMLELVAEIVRRGIHEGAFRRDVDPVAAATAFVAALEGGVMFSNLYRDASRMDAVVAHLDAFVRSLEVTRAPVSPAASRGWPR